MHISMRAIGTQLLKEGIYKGLCGIKRDTWSLDDSSCYEYYPKP